MTEHNRGSMKHEKNGKSVKNYTIREMSCQFPPPGGSIGPRFVSQLLFSEKSQNSANIKAGEKIRT
jgi:hypothetical protein